MSQGLRALPRLWYQVTGAGDVAAWAGEGKEALSLGLLSLRTLSPPPPLFLSRAGADVSAGAAAAAALLLPPPGEVSLVWLRPTCCGRRGERLCASCYPP